jgi:hypothetical protein
MGGSALIGARDRESAINRERSAASPPIPTFPHKGGRGKDAPSFERYGDGFDPVTGLGIVEIWIPLKR